MEFTPDKLETTLMSPTTEDGAIEDRKYTLTHSDETGMLFLDIGEVYNYSAISISPSVSFPLGGGISFSKNVQNIGPNPLICYK